MYLLEPEVPAQMYDISGAGKPQGFAQLPLEAGKYYFCFRAFLRNPLITHAVETQWELC